MVDFKRMQWLIKHTPDKLFAISRAMGHATLGSSNLSGMPRGSGGNDKLERSVITLIEVKDAYIETIQELEQMRQELRPMIDALEDPDEQAVMRLRYLDGHSPDVIANCNYVPMARRTVYRCLRRAEDKINMMQMQ